MPRPVSPTYDDPLDPWLEQSRADAVASVVTVFSTTVPLVGDQIQTLPTIAVTLIPAPGPNKLLIPVAAIIIKQFVTGYTNVDANVKLGIVEDPDTSFNFLSTLNVGNILWEGTTDAKIIMALRSDEPFALAINSAPQFDIVTDKPLALGMINGALGNLVGGDEANTLKVTVLYMIIDVSL